MHRKNSDPVRQQGATYRLSKWRRQGGCASTEQCDTPGMKRRCLGAKVKSASGSTRDDYDVRKMSYYARRGNVANHCISTSCESSSMASILAAAGVRWGATDPVSSRSRPTKLDNCDTTKLSGASFGPMGEQLLQWNRSVATRRIKRTRSSIEPCIVPTNSYSAASPAASATRRRRDRVAITR